MSKKVKVTSDREVKTYSEFWHTSSCLLEMAKDFEKGSFHLVMSSLVFTAFSFEAFLNHIGSKVFLCWDDLEKLNPKEKLNVIAEKLNIDAEYGKQPWQIINQLFKFRNEIAHGKTKYISMSKIESLEKYNKYYGPGSYRAETNWEKYCTVENAVLARTNVVSMVNILISAANLKNEYPFQFDLETGGGTMLDDRRT